jgi:hypothetical protein
MNVTPWQELYGNVFVRRIDRRFLNPKGFLVRHIGLLKGDPAKAKPIKRRLVVKFDRDFVVAKIANVIKPIANHPEIQSILRDAIDLANSTTEEKE